MKKTLILLSAISVFALGTCFAAPGIGNYQSSNNKTNPKKQQVNSTVKAQNDGQSDDQTDQTDQSQTD